MPRAPRSAAGGPGARTAGRPPWHGRWSGPGAAAGSAGSSRACRPPAAGPHPHPAGRREAHGRVHALPAEHRGHARTVAELGDHHAPVGRRLAGLAAKADDALALIESGYAAANGDEAAFKKWFEKGGRKAMERVETMLQPVDKHGLDEIFSLFTRHALDLGLQPVTVEFVRQTLQTLVMTLANMDHEMSDACRRRSA